MKLEKEESDNRPTLSSLKKDAVRFSGRFLKAMAWRASIRMQQRCGHPSGESTYMEVSHPEVDQKFFPDQNCVTSGRPRC
jgi:hypothetical protein